MEIKNVLIVEDDQFQSKVLERILSSLTQATIRTAINGIEAFKSIENTTPDIIFCDLYMPEMDGVEFIRQLSVNKFSIPVVLTSSAENDVQRAVIDMSKSYGISRIESLTKPIKREQISKALAWGSQELKREVSSSQTTTSHSFSALKQALYTHQFEPFFQAHIDAQTGKIIGAESLVRWNHPTLGVLSPFHFLDQLVEFGLSYQLSCLMIRQSIDVAASWLQKGWSMGISVNITPSDLEQPDFADRIIQIVDEARYPSHKLTLEVTETELATDFAKSLENTSRLRMRGIAISIDDFGTGHSSLSQLLSSPFTELKIDRFFVKSMTHNEKHLATIQFIIGLGKSLGLKIVAEGVETQEQARKLSQLKCDVLQGYYLAKPMSETKFNELCTKHFSNATS